MDKNDVFSSHFFKTVWTLKGYQLIQMGWKTCITMLYLLHNLSMFTLLKDLGENAESISKFLHIYKTLPLWFDKGNDEARQWCYK